MKVGVYCPDTNPEAGGGYTYQIELIYALLELVDRSTHEFIFFTHYPESIQKFIGSKQIQIVKTPKYPFIPCRFFEGLRYGIGLVFNRLLKFIPQRDNYRHFNRFEKIAQSHDIDFLWFPSPPVSVPLNIPYLATIWDLQHRAQPFFPEVTMGGTWEQREFFNSRYLQRASVIVVGTETGRKEVEHFYQVPHERIKVLPFPTPRFALTQPLKEEQEILKKYAIPHNYLFYPAQFWSHKNHANLLIALQILIQKYNLRVPLVLVGSDKGNENYIRKLITKLELSSQVHILGFVPQEDMVLLYQNALTLIFMTFFGPDNLPPLEAFALGCPVIASKVSGAEEQFGDAALLVDPRNPEQIADAIFNLYSSPDIRNTLIERGSIRAQMWKGQDFIMSIFSILDEFETIRKCWE